MSSQRKEEGDVDRSRFVSLLSPTGVGKRPRGKWSHPTPLPSPQPLCEKVSPLRSGPLFTVLNTHGSLKNKNTSSRILQWSTHAPSSSLPKTSLGRECSSLEIYTRKFPKNASHTGVSVSLGHLPATPYMQWLPPKPFVLEGPSRHLFHTLPGKKVNIFQWTSAIN